MVPRVLLVALAAEMVTLRGGTYRLGELTGPRYETVTYERVRPFLIDTTEVTVAGYGECVKAGKCAPAPATVHWDGITAAERESWSQFCNRDRPDRADHPVNCVDWAQASAYCAWAGKRLPTEAEWEWAARNGKSATRYPWGDEPPGRHACWNGEGNEAGAGRRSGTCPVGSHSAGDSAFGVAGLGGNVWEWTSSTQVIFADSRGRGGWPAKVARGGGWDDADPRALSASIRSAQDPATRSPYLGFRCARRQ